MSTIRKEQIETYSASDVINDSGVAGATVDIALDNAASGGSLDLDRIFYVNSAGSDSDNGKSETTPFLTLAKAITETLLLSRGSATRVGIKLIGGMDVTTNFTIPDYTTIDAFDASFSCEIKGETESILNAGSIRGPGGASASISMTAGLSSFVVNAGVCDILGTLVKNTSASGTIVINAGTILGGTLALITPGSTGDIEINVAGNITADPVAVNGLWIHNGAGVITITANDIIDNQGGAGTSLTQSNSGSMLFNINRYLSPNHRLYAISSGGEVFVNARVWDDSFGGDVLTGNLELDIQQDSAFKTVIRNDDGGVRLETDHGADIEFSAQGDVLFTGSRFKLGPDALVYNNTRNLVNLTTTPVSAGTFNANGIYLMSLVAPGASSMTFIVTIGLNGSNLGFDLSNLAGGLSANPFVGTYDLTVNGYGGPTYEWNINLTTGISTLETNSGTATGTTVFSVLGVMHI